MLVKKDQSFRCLSILPKNVSVTNSGAILPEVIEHCKYKETVEPASAEYRGELGLPLKGLVLLHSEVTQDQLDHLPFTFKYAEKSSKTDLRSVMLCIPCLIE